MNTHEPLGKSSLRLHFRPFTALAESIHSGYSIRDLRSDVLAGLIVGVIALPLSMALAIASGVPPQHGLYTAIVAGGLIALLGGSRVQISGPTAAFVVILAPISAQYGIGGLALATVLAGGLLVAMGLARLGRLIQFIPYPVVTGFTAGIAVVIATLQVKDFLGLAIDHVPHDYLGKVVAMANAMHSVNPLDLGIGIVTLGLLLLFPRLVTRKIPAPIVALPIAAILGYGLTRFVDGAEIATIASQFSYTEGANLKSGIPQLPPMPALPWTMSDGHGESIGLSIELLRALIMPAFAIAMLGAIESLLSAVVADGMAQTTHDPDAELVAQGIGNIVAPFFGGFAATGAIARTATNIRSGGRSPVAGVVHALFVLTAVLVLAPLLGYLPMAALAALLLVVAWNMSEARHFVHVLRVAPRSDAIVLLSCFLLTVIFDMVISISVGIVLAALLFMRRMTEVSGTTLLAEDHPTIGRALPRGVLVYEIAGPLFFGAASKAASALRAIGNGVHTVVLDMRAVPVMDATGLVNLESAIDRLRRSGIRVLVGGVRPEVIRLLVRAGWREKYGHGLVVHRRFEDALDDADRIPVN